MKALLVEDNRMNQLITKAQLTLLGYEVTVADDGVAGLKLALVQVFDLILTDFDMPNMNGIEMTKKIRINEREKAINRATIMAFSAAMSPSREKDFFAAGVQTALSKPISLSELRTAISTISPS